MLPGFPVAAPEPPPQLLQLLLLGQDDLGLPVDLSPFLPVLGNLVAVFFVEGFYLSLQQLYLHLLLAYNFGLFLGVAEGLAHLNLFVALGG